MPIETTTLADRILALARAELDAGVCESGGPNCGLPSTRYMGGRTEPWCAWWVAWLYREAGRPLPGDRIPDGRACALASVAHMERVFGEHGWLVQRPRRGDIVFFGDRGNSDGGRGRHVALVERETPQLIVTIGGNEGDRVQRVAHQRVTFERRARAYGRVPDLP